MNMKLVFLGIRHSLVFSDFSIDSKLVSESFQFKQNVQNQFFLSHKISSAFNFRELFQD